MDPFYVSIFILQSTSRKLRENSMEKNLQAYNHNRKLAEWAQRVQSCRESGLSVRQWCDENGLSAKTYYYWQIGRAHV